MKINVKSPLLWIAVVFAIVAVAYLSGGHIVAGIVCFVIGGACFFFSALKKPVDPRPVPQPAQPVPVQPNMQKSVVNGEEWDLSRPIILKNDKEWFDADKRYASPSGAYYVCEGSDASGNEAVSLISSTEGLKIRRIEEGICDVVVTDSGIGLVLLDDNSLLVISADSANVKKLAAEDACRDTHFLVPSVCVICGWNESSDKVCVDGYDVAGGKVWHKSFPAEYTESDINISVSDSIVSVSVGGATAQYHLNGDAV